jgi:hypothetical protein
VRAIYLCYICVSNIQHRMYRWSGFTSNRKDAIAKMSKQRGSEQIHAFVSGRSFDKSELDHPVKENIGVLPEHWQILWSNRIAGLPHVWSNYVNIVENTFITVD